MGKKQLQLVRAATVGNRALVSSLLQEGTKADVTYDTVPPLWLAAKFGHVDVVRVLLEHGAGVNRPVPDGSTPLFAAVVKGHAATVALLLKNKADATIRGCMGLSPLQVAASTDHPEVMELLLTHAVESLGASAQLPGRGNMFWIHQSPEIKALLETEGHVNSDKASALAIAVSKGLVRVVKLLLARGADPRRVRENGSTDLIAAVKNNCPGVAIALLHAGADVGYVDHAGLTAIDYSKLQKLTAITLLLERHAEKLAEKQAAEEKKSLHPPSHCFPPFVHRCTATKCGKTEETEMREFKKCVRCRLARYCSALCNKSDWRRHRKTCESPSKLAEQID